MPSYSDPTGVKPATLKDLEVVFQNVVSVVLAFAGVVLFIMLLKGGFTYLTSGGEAAKAEAAKKTITFALAGIILLTLSYLVLVFLENFTGISLTNFNVFQDR